MIIILLYCVFVLCFTVLFLTVETAKLKKRVNRLDELVRRLNDMHYMEILTWETGKKIGDLFGEEKEDDQAR